MEPNGLAVLVVPARCNTTGRSDGANRPLTESHLEYADIDTGVFCGASSEILSIK